MLTHVTHSIPPSPEGIFKGEKPMSLTTFLQQCLTGISLGGAYALIAIGYTMVYGILRLINFAHGDIFMMAGYFMIFAMASLPWYIAVPVTLITTTALGVGIDRRVLPAAEPRDLPLHRAPDGLSGDPGAEARL